MECVQACYSLIRCSDMEPPNELQLKLNLENGDIQTKIDTLKRIICYISNGDRLPGVLMPIIRFVMPLQDHTLKKLMLIFWEIIPKTKADGSLLQEVILVCDAYRKDLEHPNEFIRGATLRFLCKLKEPELLEPLMMPIRNCLEHKRSYVRRNAVLAIFTIYRNFPFLINDATELVLRFLEAEKDMSCKRNAFLMLLHTDLEKALSYLISCLDEVTSYGDILQLMVVQLMHKVCLESPEERPRFIRVIYSLLNSSSSAVRYEASGTLLTLTSAPAAVKAATSCYIDIITKESDNNVKLIVLERLISLRDNPNNDRVLQELVMDVLRVLTCRYFEVKEKGLAFVIDLMTQDTAGEVVSTLMKEIVKISKDTDEEDSIKYFQLLLKTIHSCSIKYKSVASITVPYMMGFLVTDSEIIALDIINYTKIAIENFHFLQTLIMHKLLDVFTNIKFPKVHQSALWILGEYVNTIILIEKTLSVIKKSLGNLPLVEDEFKLILEDQGSIFEDFLPQQKVINLVFANRPIIRKYLIENKFMIGSTVSTTLVKLAFKYESISKDVKHSNNFLAECTLVITSILRFGTSKFTFNPISVDDAHRMLFCIQVLKDQKEFIKSIFTTKCHRAFLKMLNFQGTQNSGALSKKIQKKICSQIDETVSFSQLSNLKKYDIGPDNMIDLNFSNSVSFNEKKSNWNDSSLDSGKITQLTGFSDPVYAEAFVQPSQYNVTLDVLIVNRTDDMLENCCLELATIGQLRLIEKPQSCVLPPRATANVRVIVRVSSTENGIIFGKISYDLCGQPDHGMVVLNEIHIDIAQHLQPLHCSEEAFRTMWTDLEWENKVVISTNITGIEEFSDHIRKLTNMYCLTPEKVLHNSCKFHVANFYARSIFGEDALVNICSEKLSDASESSIVGRIRIRAKSQGMALYLGEVINNGQKKPINT